MGNPRNGNPDLRRVVTAPAPSNEELETRRRDYLSPGTFANLKTVKDKQRSLRDRILTLPVVVAIVLSLVYLSANERTERGVANTRTGGVDVGEGSTGEPSSLIRTIA